MSRESKATKEEIQRNRDEAYQNGWSDGYAEGYGKATVAALPPAQPDAEEPISDQRIEYEKLCARISAGKASQQDAVDAIRQLCRDNERFAVLLGKAKATPAPDAVEALVKAAEMLKGVPRYSGYDIMWQQDGHKSSPTSDGEWIRYTEALAAIRAGGNPDPITEAYRLALIRIRLLLQPWVGN